MTRRERPTPHVTYINRPTFQPNPDAERERLLRIERIAGSFIATARTERCHCEETRERARQVYELLWGEASKLGRGSKGT